MYAKIINNVVEQYPYRLTDFRKEHPLVSLPRDWPADALAQYNIYEIVRVVPPTVDPATHKVVEGDPVLDGSWKQAWIVVEKTQQEKDEYARQALIDSRPDLAMQRLVTVATVLKDIRTRQDGRDYVAANANTVLQLGAIVGDLVFVVAQVVRLQLREDDSFFPNGE